MGKKMVGGSASTSNRKTIESTTNNDDVQELRQELEEKEHRIQQLEKQIESLSNQLSAVTDLRKQIEQSSKHRATLTRRIRSLEEILELDEIDYTTISEQSRSKAEKYALLPDNLLKKEVTKVTQRAVLIYKNFENISERANSAIVADSNDIRSLLSGNEEKPVEWTLVYRAMERFDEITSDEFRYQNEKNRGRILIKEP